MRPSLRSLIASFLEWAAVRFRPATVSLYRRYLSAFADHAAKVPFVRIGRRHVETFSVKKHPLEIVRRFFKWAADMGDLQGPDPCKGVAVPKSGRRSRTLTPRERVLLRRHARPQLRHLLLAMEETAARPHEARGIEWEQLRTVDGSDVTPAVLREGKTYFALPRFKAQHRRSNPYIQRPIIVTPRLGRLLARLWLRRAAQGGAVFRSSSGRAWSPSALRCSFRRLRRKAAARSQIAAAGIVPYLYRHTKATALAVAGVNGRLLADYLGHSTLELLAWYVHPSVNDLCEIARRRPRKQAD